ncbi:amidohydrolase family protein [Cohnella nanjingensis]|uniref:Amidohydrolase family protein n=1 Tax=Cohnella nanjingensis TaxID=1387779 RepID=A0A7X0RWL2_9BACL|nr:amidohydrolase family protein [Cohnella nanjingensis]MBB6674930.1 amidohydrolase family protein [Cohnella nanjingensis]
MRIDAHQHYWSIARGDYGWITPELPVLHRDFLPSHLAPHLASHSLDGSIAVQAAPTLAETSYLLSLAEREASILGVVGWLDLDDPAHLAHFERFRKHPKYVGFRVMIQEMPDALGVLDPAFVDALRHYAALDVPVDLLLKSDQLASVAELLDLVPGLRGVIDHLAKPRIAAGEMEPWLGYMRRIAGHPNISCKLSGMVTEAEHGNWRPEQLTPYVRAVAELFGPDRVLFGSDWPVCLLAANYDETVSALEQALPEAWGDAERAKLYGLNAKEFYKCGQR